jgi:1,2-phenylacetyl-CoA epoxidase catalytic subunit
MSDFSRTPACHCFARLCERQGYRELAAAELFSAAVPLAPTIDEKQMFARHCLDELGHFESVAVRYEEQVGQNLLVAVAPRLAELRRPGSWLEMVIVGLVFDRAVYYQLRSYAMASDPRVASLAVSVIADEQEHLAASQAALADLARQDKGLGERASELVRAWLPVALACFDGPEAPCPNGPHLSGEAALEARRRYFEDLASVLAPMGVPRELFEKS